MAARMNTEGWTNLHHAVGERFINLILSLLEQNNGMVNIQDEQGRTPLHLVCSGVGEHEDLSSKTLSDTEQIITLLLSYGADTEILDNSGKSPIHCLVHHFLNNQFPLGEVGKNIITRFTQCGADINGKDRNGRTPLHYVAGSTVVEVPVVKTHQEEEAINPRRRNQNLGQAFGNELQIRRRFVYMRNIPEQREMIMMIINPRIRDLAEHGQLVLPEPGQRENEPAQRENEPGQRENVPGQRYIEPGQRNIEPGQRDNVPGQRDIEPGQRNIEPGQRNIEPGQRDIEPGQRDNDPGQRYIEPGQRDIEPGQRDIEPGQRDIEPGQRGNEPGLRDNEPGQRDNEPERISNKKLNANLTYAKEFTLLLLSSGADVNASDNNGNTPLHFAISAKRFDLFKVMMKRKVNVNIKNDEGQTLLHHAVSSYQKFEHCGVLLLDNGALASIADIKGRTPLDIARDRDLFYAFLKHLILLISVKLHPCMSIQTNNDREEKFKEICEKECKDLNTYFELHGRSKLPLLLRYNCLPTYTKNEFFQTIMERSDLTTRFPNYYSYLKNKFSHDQKRIKMIEESTHKVFCYFGGTIHYNEVGRLVYTKNSHWETLPKELKSQILSYLSTEELEYLSKHLIQ